MSHLFESTRIESLDVQTESRESLDVQTESRDIESQMTV